MSIQVRNWEFMVGSRNLDSAASLRLLSSTSLRLLSSTFLFYPESTQVHLCRVRKPIAGNRVLSHFVNKAPSLMLCNAFWGEGGICSYQHAFFGSVSMKSFL